MPPLVIGVFFVACAAAQPAASPPSAAKATTSRPSVYSQDQVLSSIQHGVDFLLRDQNADGSWGGARGAVYTFTGDVWSNPETHRAWRVATTGLSCLALMHSSDTDAAAAAVRRGLDYILDNADIRRPDEWDTMNCWAYIYGLQALADAFRRPGLVDEPRKARMRERSALLVKRLAESQSTTGGWGYLEFDPPRTATTQWATSFTTSAAVVAMFDAQHAGLPFDEPMFGRAVRALERCRMASGAYTYSVQAIADPRRSEWIDNIKGSLSRIQCCNIALRLAGRDVPDERLRVGIRQFFEHHRFLDIACNRPIPHETYYYNSGYFYLFGHYYAARVIAELPAAEQADLWPRLQRELIKMQQADGSMWDYDMHAYHKPYGTSFALLALSKSVQRP